MTDTNDSRTALPGPDTWDDESIGDGPSPDELFRILADTARRRTLWFLLNNRRTTIHEVADTLVGWRASENDIVGPEERDRILLSLHHAHLPMLVRGGLVTYDTDAGEIRRSSLSEPVRDVIRFSCRYEQAVAAADSR